VQHKLVAFDVPGEIVKQTQKRELRKEEKEGKKMQVAVFRVLALRIQ